MKFNIKQNKFLIVLFLIVIIVFSKLSNFGFLNWDDHVHLFNNNDILSLSFENLKKIFTSFYAGMYQPLTTLLFSFEYKLFGFNPIAFHLVSLFIHVINVLLVFLLLKLFKFSELFAFSVALIFGIHALQVEAVSWISARSTLTYSMFFLLAIISYLKYLDNEKKLYIVFSLVFFMLSVLSKPSAISFVLLLPFIHYYKEIKFKRLDFMYFVFLFFIAVVIAVLTIFSRPDVDLISGDQNYDLFKNLLFVFWSLCLYVFNFLFPFNLSPWVAYPDEIKWYMITVPIVILTLLFLLVYYSKQRKSILLGIALFIVPLSVHLKIVPFGGQFIADRYMYLSIIGGSILLFSLVFNFIDKRFELRHLILKVLFVLLFFLINIVNTLSNLDTWKSSETLWSKVIEKEPTETIGYYNRGVFYRDRGRMIEAESDFSSAITLNPVYIDAYFARGGVYNIINEFRKAENDFSAILSINPDFQKAYFNRANSRFALEDFVSALSDYKKYLSFVKDHEQSEFKIILCMIELNYSIDEIRSALNSFVMKYSENAEANYMLGLSYINYELTEACKYLNKAAELKHQEARRISVKLCF